MSPRSRRSDALPAASAALGRLNAEAGAQLFHARTDRRWTLTHLADRAGVAVATAQAAEAGRGVSLETYARLAAALGLRPTLELESPRRAARVGSDLVHSAMAELEASHLQRLGFKVAIDEPYQHFQFAGRADVLAWNLERRALLHIENKTRLQDLQELAGAYNAKRRYLPAVIAERLGLGSRGWASVTHVLATLWSSEVLHVLRLRGGTFSALCPDTADALAAWWKGRSPPIGTTSALILLDPDVSLSARRVRWIDADAVASARPRYRDYADAAAALSRR